MSGERYLEIGKNLKSLIESLTNNIQYEVEIISKGKKEAGYISDDEITIKITKTKP